ncbi:MAG: alanyl-tRNA editing protein [Acidobacteria bacterium]|nr:alanyl-tRNA editing protein [Acidobacteriota bacterium]
MTERLYYTNSKLLEFTGRVTDILRRDDRLALVLDRTAFYPTGGGQPHDKGQLDGVRVVEVIEEEGSGQVLHFVAGEVGFDPGREVTGVIDWQRRLDHMQQHTGQHILSQAFVQVARAETKSFHLGAESSTIDLDWDRPDEALIRQAEELANQIVFDNRPVKIHQVAKEELGQFPIRRDTYHGDVVRLIEISDFDFSPCGGTHAERTGEIGLIAIRDWERAKKMCRVEFGCGGRALRDYRAANGTAKSIALMLTVARDDAPEKVARLMEENKQQRRRIRELFNIAADVEAEQLFRTAEQQPNFRLVRNIFRDRSMDEARILARKLCDHGGVVALFGLDDQGAARLLFARSADLDFNMGDLMKHVMEQLGGRGGGSPDMAQGGIGQLEQLPASLDLALKEFDKQ